MAKKMRKFASAGSVGRKATEQAMTGVEDILKSAPSLVAAAQSDKSAESAMKAAAAPKKAPSFAEAFRAARAAGDKTFTWGGKSFAAKMAGEDVKRPQLARSGTGASTASRPAAPAATPKDTGAAYRSQAGELARSKNRAEMRKKTVEAEPKRDNTAAGRRERMGKFLSSLNPYNQADAKGKSGRPILLTGEAARKANKGTVGGYAKGGKIDGCAIRGKTRAPMKKGK